MSNSTSMSMMNMSPFTVSQWHELEHQALILKYLLAGMPVPPDLLFPIQKSFDSLSSTFFPNTPLGYCSFYGKKVDPEPGRCRRTDGKKWRCSKDAYGDSKYCERHMHRGRNRSRKPVEQPSQTTTNTSTNTNPSLSPLSAKLSSVAVTGENSYNSSSSISGGAAAGRYQNLAMNTFGSNQSLGAATDQSQLQLEHIPYGIPHKDYRYLYGLKSDVGEHSFFSEASGKSLQVDSSLDSTWPLNSSQVSLFPTSKASDYPMLQNDYSQHSFLGNDFVTGSDHAKQSGNLVRPFFEELSKSKSGWPSDLENEISKRSSFSSTQLSISIPMGSSDLSGTSSRSPPW